MAKKLNLLGGSILINSKMPPRYEACTLCCLRSVALKLFRNGPVGNEQDKSSGWQEVQ